MELTERQFREVIQWGQSYSDFKKSFEEYLDSCLRSMEYFKSRIFSMLKVRNGMCIDIDYCDRHFILDFSIIKKSADSFIACAKIYKVEQGLGIPTDQEELVLVGDSIYVDPYYIYELKDGSFEISKDTKIDTEWLEDLIVSALHHTFD